MRRAPNPSSFLLRRELYPRRQWVKRLKLRCRWPRIFPTARCFACRQAPAMEIVVLPCPDAGLFRRIQYLGTRIQWVASSPYPHRAVSSMSIVRSSVKCRPWTRFQTNLISDPPLISSNLRSWSACAYIYIYTQRNGCVSLLAPLPLFMVGLVWFNLKPSD